MITVGDILYNKRQRIKILKIEGELLQYLFLDDNKESYKIGTISNKANYSTVCRHIEKGDIQIDESNRVTKILNQYL
jgi:hypothetical protein